MISASYRDAARLAALASGLEVERRVLESTRGKVLAYHWYVGLDSFGTELVRSALALDRGPWRRDQRALVVRASTGLVPTRDWAKQEADLADVAEYLNEEIQRIEPSKQDG